MVWHRSQHLHINVNVYFAEPPCCPREVGVEVYFSVRRNSCSKHTNQRPACETHPPPMVNLVLSPAMKRCAEWGVFSFIFFPTHSYFTCQSAQQV